MSGCVVTKFKAAPASSVRFSSLMSATKHTNLRKSKEILCPCIDCDNKIAWRDTGIIQAHLLKRGFKTITRYGQNMVSWIRVKCLVMTRELSEF
jgi:hypothetical protein